MQRETEKQKTSKKQISKWKKKKDIQINGTATAYKDTFRCQMETKQLLNVLAIIWTYIGFESLHNQ